PAAAGPWPRWSPPPRPGRPPAAPARARASRRAWAGAAAGAPRARRAGRRAARTAGRSARPWPARRGRSSVGGIRVGRVVAVTGAPDRRDPPGARRVGLDLLPQPPHVHGDGGLVAELPAPHLGQELRARVRPDR